MAENVTMEILFILIGFSLLLALLFLGAFFLAVRTGQYDDRHTPALRMLRDDAPAKPHSQFQEE
ncbi:MAG: cbb3-type cytochrome oxidase assembly protein CcoS [Blastocatellia bacterium]